MTRSAAEGAPKRGRAGVLDRDRREEAAVLVHDPCEITVELAGVQNGFGERPVFVDASGRRSRRFRRLGIVVGIVCAAYAAVIAVTLLSGNSDAPWLPVPVQDEDMPASRVGPSASVSAEPTARPSGGNGLPPAAAPGRSSGTASGASGTAAPEPDSGNGPRTSADPGPSASRATAPAATATGTTESPASGATSPTAPASSQPAGSGSPGAGPSAGAGSPAPSGSAGGGTSPGSLPAPLPGSSASSASTGSGSSTAPGASPAAIP